MTDKECAKSRRKWLLAHSLFSDGSHMSLDETISITAFFPIVFINNHKILG